MKASLSICLMMISWKKKKRWRNFPFVSHLHPSIHFHVLLWNDYKKNENKLTIVLFPLLSLKPFILSLSWWEMRWNLFHFHFLLSQSWIIISENCHKMLFNFNPNKSYINQKINCCKSEVDVSDKVFLLFSFFFFVGFSSVIVIGTYILCICSWNIVDIQPIAIMTCATQVSEMKFINVIIWLLAS